MSISTEVHRYQVLLDQGSVRFRQVGTEDLLAEVRVECLPGRHVVLFDLEPGSAARFAYEAVQWLDRGEQLADYRPIPRPACMQTQRDGDARVAIWNDNLNFPLGGDGSDEIYGFVLALVGAEGVIVSSSDPVIVNKPDAGPGAGRGPMSFTGGEPDRPASA